MGEYRRVCAVGLAASLVVLGLAVPRHALAANAAVTLNSDDIDLDVIQFVDDATQTNPEKTDQNFIAFAGHLHPATSKAVEGTASNFVNAGASMETPAQPPLPGGPLNDIGFSGRATSDATATGNGNGVPVSDAEGELNVDFTTGATAVPVFFSGAALTANDDSDSCSRVEVALTGSSPSQHFNVYTGGDCPSTKRHSVSWAKDLTLAANSEYELGVDYESEVSDARPDDPGSLSSSASVDLNLSFYPPSAKFSTTLSGSTAHFNAAGSGSGDPSRQIAKYLWTFGDGKTKTTTGPQVVHTYPAAPVRATSYPVTLQTLDSGGALSPVVSHDVIGTTIHQTAKTAKSPVKVHGSVAPGRSGQHVFVSLLHKKPGGFRQVSRKRLTLNRHSVFSVSVPVTVSGRCEIVSRYPGDHTHLASAATKPFAC